MLINYNNLTKTQQVVVDAIRKLETRYGAGNVFIAYNTAMKRYCYKIHGVGEKKFIFLLDYVNARTLKAMENLSLFDYCDIMHNAIDADHCKNDVECVGYRLRTEIIIP